ncbi:hypothetical protein P154DRAFT_211169 [Amniculicola lignicola CBS 123094]|uniref:Uncharacterized protein n=1 Tax=Amniculicola lignicola CBS 123094 TaxID=1392246 RepID=A0A6A5WDF0_9PLEO|nr:hypothetical protein P154DRAFT_211169 [Amniculicola lignicola CBS 123094]
MRIRDLRSFNQMLRQHVLGHWHYYLGTRHPMYGACRFVPRRAMLAPYQPVQSAKICVGYRDSNASSLSSNGVRLKPCHVTSDVIATRARRDSPWQRAVYAAAHHPPPDGPRPIRAGPHNQNYPLFSAISNFSCMTSHLPASLPASLRTSPTDIYCHCIHPQNASDCIVPS